MKEINQLEARRQRMALVNAVRSKRAKDTKEIAKRFWKKVALGGEDECWPWLGGTDADGYGMFFAAGERIVASRFAWQLANGRPIRKGFVAAHTCDNPSCCNAKHIKEWTGKQNMEDAANKSRTLKGERNPKARLCAEKVREIRKLRQSGMMLKYIVEIINVSIPTVSQVALRQTWKHI